MNILVAGASGYLGSHLVESLSGRYSVTSLIRPTSSLDRLRDGASNIRVFSSIEDLDLIFREERPDIIINSVAVYGRKKESKSTLVYANTTLPSALFELSACYGATAFLNAGSSLDGKVSFYAKSKSDFVSSVMATHDGPKFINVVLEHFYGPGDDASKFTANVIRSCIKGEALELTSGIQKRDFVYIDDVVRAFEFIVLNLSRFQSRELVSVGSGTASPVRDFVELVHKISHSSSFLKFGVVPLRENEQMYSCADLTRMNSLGWTPTFSLVDGIKKAVKSYE